MDICAVIVTFNRLECLKKALKKYEEQIKRPKYLLIVNNNSSDGTKEYLETWKQEPSEIQKIVLHLPSNTGGAGGFHAGMEKALELDCDWVWVSDDDAYPEPDALKSMEDFYESHPLEQRKIAAMCGTIMDYDKKKILLGHHCRSQKVMGVAVMKEVPVEEYHKDFFELDLFILMTGSILCECENMGKLYVSLGQLCFMWEKARPCQKAKKRFGTTIIRQEILSLH